jgi:O-antigen ligase
VVGPAIIAALTLPALASRIDDLFENNRLIGSVGYYNGEAAFLLVPFWAAVYLTGSRRVNPILRSLILAGAVLSVEVAVLTQSRGAMVGMAISLPIFFLISGQRLRGFFALAPVALALFITFPGLNAVYLAFLDEKSAQTAFEQVLPTVLLTVTGAGLYGLLWGLVDRRWQLPSSVTRVIGGITLISSIAVLVFGVVAFTEHVGNPVTWGEQSWEAFKNDDTTNQEESRYLAASGSGRYTFWQVAWTDFAAHPLLGVGTHNYEATYYQLREQPVGYIRQPHSLPLEVLSERGIVGGVLFFGFLATCLAAGLRRRFRNLGAEGKAQVGAMVAAVSYWFVHSSAEWFWQMPAVTLPIIIYLALLVVSWHQVEEAPQARWPGRAVGAGVAMLVIIAIVPLYATERYLVQSRDALITMNNPWVALEAVESAQWFNPVNPQLAQREGRLRTLIGDWPQAEEAYREAIRENPEHYVPYVFLARLHEQTGETEEALEAYRQALALNPLDEQLNQEVSQFEASADR